MINKLIDIEEKTMHNIIDDMYFKSTPDDIFLLQTIVKLVQNMKNLNERDKDIIKQLSQKGFYERVEI